MGTFQEIRDSNAGGKVLVNLEHTLAIIPRQGLVNNVEVPSIRFIMIDGRVFDWHFEWEDIRKLVYEAVRTQLSPKVQLSEIEDHEMKKLSADDNL